MNISKPKTKTEIVARSYPEWDVENLLQRIWNHLEGTVSRSTIRQVLTEVIPIYESAPIQTFVLIFVHKETVERLQAGLAEAPPYHGLAKIPELGLVVQPPTLKEKV